MGERGPGARHGAGIHSEYPPKIACVLFTGAGEPELQFTLNHYTAKKAKGPLSFLVVRWVLLEGFIPQTNTTSVSSPRDLASFSSSMASETA